MKKLNFYLINNFIIIDKEFIIKYNFNLYKIYLFLNDINKKNI